MPACFDNHLHPLDGWTCPNCGRTFARTNQRHRCGIDDSAAVLRRRSPEIQQVLGHLKAFVLALGRLEVVSGEAYVLFQSTRVFLDLTVMTDAARLAIHLPHEEEHRLSMKVRAYLGLE